MSARITRVKRLLAVETSRKATKEKELADARRELEQREAAASRIEAELSYACERWLDVGSVEDLERASAHRTTITTRLGRAKEAVTLAQAEVEARNAAAVAARTAERRLEILLEGFAEADARRATKAERKTADEHAARQGSRGAAR